MRTLVLGSTGQLGTELGRVPKPRHVEVLEFARVDLRADEEVVALLKEARPALVINATAYNFVDRAEEDREGAFAINEGVPARLARWCAENGATLIHVSTDYVFDGTKAGRYTETDVTNPVNVYGASKLAGENAVRSCLAQHFILRTAWVFSAHRSNFVKTVMRAARERSDLRMVTDQLGSPTPAAMLAGAIWRIAELLPTRASFGTYHVAGATVASRYDLARSTIDAMRAETPRLKLIPITSAEYPTPARRPRSTVLDSSRFQETFEFELGPAEPGLIEVVRELEAKESS